MQVGVGGRDVKKGSSGQLFTRSFRASSPRLSWSASNRILVLFLFARLPACRAAYKKNTRTVAAHNRCGRLARQASCPISVSQLWQGQISVLFLARDAGFEGDVSAGCSRGLSRTISASVVRRRVASDGHHRIAKGAGLASWLVKSLLRRMCFAVETEDRFLRVPRPSQGNAAGILTVRHGLCWSWARR